MLCCWWCCVVFCSTGQTSSCVTNTVQRSSGDGWFEGKRPRAALFATGAYSTPHILAQWRLAQGRVVVVFTEDRSDWWWCFCKRQCCWWLHQQRRWGDCLPKVKHTTIAAAAPPSQTFRQQNWPPSERQRQQQVSIFEGERVSVALPTKRLRPRVRSVVSQERTYLLHILRSILLVIRSIA